MMRHNFVKIAPWEVEEEEEVGKEEERRRKTNVKMQIYLDEKN